MNIDEMQTLPQDIKCEQDVLGSMLTDKNRLVKFIEALDQDDFYRDAHRIIFIAISKLFADGKDVDVTLLINEIGKDNLVRVGGITYITDLITGAIPINPSNYIKILKDKSFRRKAIKQFSYGMQKMYDEESKAFEVANEVTSKLIESEEKRSAVLTDEMLMEKTLTEIEKRYQNGGEIPGMKTGISDLDSFVGGIEKGYLTIIGGRPSMGKTVFVLNLSDGLCRNGYKVFLAELEMKEEDLGMRRLAYSAGIEASKLKYGKLNDKDFIDIVNKSGEIANRNGMFTDCTPKQSLLEIKAKAKAIKQAYGLDVVVIDHLTLMDIPERGTRDLAIGEVTSGLKALAKDLDVSVILLCQLSRAVEQRADKRPMLSDLRESGNIEQDADLVTFMYRDEYYNAETEDKGILECIVAKQRNGKTGTIKLSYSAEYQRVGDLDFRY